MNLRSLVPSARDASGERGRGGVWNIPAVTCLGSSALIRGCTRSGSTLLYREAVEFERADWCRTPAVDARAGGLPRLRGCRGGASPVCRCCIRSSRGACARVLALGQPAGAKSESETNGVFSPSLVVMNERSSHDRVRGGPISSFPSLGFPSARSVGCSTASLVPVSSCPSLRKVRIRLRRRGCA